MIGLSYEQIIEKIKTEKGLSNEEIQGRIKKKLEQLSNLISKEGAAHIIANELGVKVFENLQRRFKIAKLSPVLRNIEVLGKILKLYEIRSFKTSKREGRVASILIGDETATIRVVLWDENLIKEMEGESFKEGDTIVVKNGYVRDNNGFKEIHMGSGSKIEVNPEGEKIETITTTTVTAAKKPIIELQEKEQATLTGTIVQIFEPRFYEACPECGKKLEQEQGQKFICKEHGNVMPNTVPIVNFFFDDGTENIRVVAFRQQAEKILEMNEEEILELRTNPEKFETVKETILGKQLQISGRVNKNELFNRLEFVAQCIEEADPEELITELEK